MKSQRILRAINILIGLILLLALGTTYWFAWRPLPETVGSLKAPVSARALVSRDGVGIPHIIGASLSDVFFLQGYVTAQDRLFQMDSLRRLAAGELAEIAGPSAIESDRQARRLRLTRLAQRYEKLLPDEDRAVLAAYARGVNYFLETHSDRLPLEFTLLRYEPRSWRITDSILVFLHLVRTLENSWQQELLKEALAAHGDAEKVNFLMAPGVQADLMPASNAWALGGARTSTRRPLLAGDPHLELSIPGIWYLVHLRGPLLNVAGASIPGLPGVIIGHNERIAWSITNLQADVEDLYVERLNPASGRYEFAGTLEQAQPERELIRVRNGAAEAMLVWITRHGPVVAADAGRMLALRWSANDYDEFRFPILELNRARNWEQFRAVLAHLPGPVLNFVYADAAGNIGFQVTGRLPIRRGFDGSLPVDGSSGRFEWAGWIPFEKLPSIFNPASGMIVSANQNPFPPDFPYTVNGYFAAPYRFRQIQARLGSRDGWKAGEMLSIQTDVYSAFSHFLAQQAVAAYERSGSRDTELAEAVAALRNWDGQMASGRAAPLLATLLFRRLREAAARRASGALQPVYTSLMAPLVIETLLRTRPKDWFPDYDKLILDSLREAVREGATLQGESLAKWDYGWYNRINLNNPVVGRLPLVGKYFNFGPTRMGGSQETILQKPPGQNFGPSLRMVVDFADLDGSLINIPTGQSGQVLSRHYRDQWKAYLEGRGFPMQFNKVQAKQTLEFLPEGQ